MNEKTVDICRRILKHVPEQVLFDDISDTIDGYTASMIVQIYDKLSPQNQTKADEILKYQWGVHKFWEMAGEMKTQ